MIACLHGVAGIYWVGVLPEFRKQGFASALTLYTVGQAKQKGYEYIVSQNLTASQSLFQRLGFQPLGSLNLYGFLGK